MFPSFSTGVKEIHKFINLLFQCDSVRQMCVCVYVWGVDYKRVINLLFLCGL